MVPKDLPCRGNRPLALLFGGQAMGIGGICAKIADDALWIGLAISWTLLGIGFLIYAARDSRPAANPTGDYSPEGME